MILSSSRDKSLIVWKLTRDDVGTTVSLRRDCMATVTSFLMLCYHLTVTLLCLDHGIKLYDYGISVPEKQPEDSRTIPRTSCLWPSQLTIVRSCQPVEIRQLNSGTLWHSANTLSKKMVTPIGFQPSDSLPTTRILLLCPLDGTNMSRSGT